MAAFRRPPIERYQQLAEPMTGDVDCSAWCAAIATDIDTLGAITLTGRQIRLATDEPVPDPRSPGLNLPQVDAAVFALTKGRVNLDVRVGRNAVKPDEFERHLVDGRWTIVQVNRGVLLALGIGRANRFRGGHAVVVGFDQDLRAFIVGDPLVPEWERAPLAAVTSAAEMFSPMPGLYAAFTRDVYTPPLIPPRPAKLNALFEPGNFWVYAAPPKGMAGWMRASRQFSKATSAPVAGQVTYFDDVLGKRRKLARIAKGALAGRYVEPGASHVRVEAA